MSPPSKGNPMSAHAQTDSKTRHAPPAARLQGLPGLVVKRILSHLRTGRVVIDLPNGERIDHAADRPGVEAHIIVHRWRALRRLISSGDLGFAESFIAGDWTSPDLVSVMEIAADNGGEFFKQMSMSLPLRIVNRVMHFLHSNTRAGSRRNIEFHYDLGNEFYSRWLDASMIYSSAIYASPDSTLEEAQAEKVREIIRRLEVRSGDSVLEIGCGWGTLAMEIAAQSGAHVTGITLSPSQLEFAKSRVAEAGLERKVELKLEDYRDTPGQFDRIVSIEMIEAVGRKYLPRYFGAVHDRLKPQGIAVIQAITISEDREEAYRAQPDFIQRYIFPGGFLPTKTAIAKQAADAGMKLVETNCFGQSYARTLAEWRLRFNDNWEGISKLGFDESFHRLWNYYLSYCEAGFKTGVIDVGHYTVIKSSSIS